MLASSTGHAQSVVDNLSGSFVGPGIVNLAGQGLAQAFTTGPDERALGSIAVLLNAPGDNATDPTLEIWSGDGDLPTSRVENLGVINLPSTASTSYLAYELTSSQNPRLEPNTRYWVVLIRSSSGSGFNWSVTSGTSAPGEGSIDPKRANTFSSGTSWSVATQTNALQFAVNGLPVVLVQNVNDSGSGSLRQAIADIPAGGVVGFDASLSGCTISLNSPIGITKGLRIDASDLRDGIILNANQQSRIFETASTDQITMDSLTLTGGKISGSGGGAIRNFGVLALRRCALIGNSSSFGGGAIHNSGASASLGLDGTLISGNSASFGGGLWHQSGLLAVTFSTITENTGSGGTGGAVLEGGFVFLINSILAANTGPVDPDLGGAGSTIAPGGVNLIGRSGSNYASVFPSGLPNANDDFVGTNAVPLDPLLAPLGRYGGPTRSQPPLSGSFAIDPAGGLTDANLTDQRGFPGLVGITADAGSVESSDFLVVDTTEDGSPSGATSLREAIAQATGPAGKPGTFITFDPDVFTNPDHTIALNGTPIDVPNPRGLTLYAGGLTNGVVIDGGHQSRLFSIGQSSAPDIPTYATFRGLTLKNGASNGTLNGNGGAILNENNSLALSHCSLFDNAAAFGGAIYNQGFNGSAALHVEHCSIVDNSASNRGGGIYSFGSSGTAIVDLSHTSILDNEAADGGGGLFLDGSAGGVKLRLAHSILAQNGAPSGPDLRNISGTVGLSGVNLVSDLSDSGITDPADGTLLQGDPLLAERGHYGGPTQTRPPLPESPVVNAATGSTATSDQRGFPVNGVPDLGAAESQTFLVVKTTADEDNGTGDLSLREAVAAATAPSALPGTFITFDPAVFTSTNHTIVLDGNEILIPAPQALTIYAGDLPFGVTIDADRRSRIFFIGQDTVPAEPTQMAIHGLTLTRGFAEGNSPANRGGGIYNRNNFLTVVDSTFLKNAAAFGAGLMNHGSSQGRSTLFVSHSSFLENAAFSQGGGIYNRPDGGKAILFVSRSSFFGNTAFLGGGINNSAGAGGESAVSVSESSIVGNTASLQGGGLFFVPEFEDRLRLFLENTIIAQNSASLDPDLSNLYQSVTLSGVNLLSSLEGSGIAPSPDILVISDPLLAPLGDYGGPTQTRPPLPGSPVIDAATRSTSTSDQRGFPTVGTPDIGAAEFQGTADLARYWPLDWDGDGLAYGVEQALGTEVLISDRDNPRNLAISRDAIGSLIVTFGRNPSADPGTIWILTCSPDLSEGSFQEVYYADSLLESWEDGFLPTSGPDGIQTIELPPSEDSAFYRLETPGPR